MKRVAITGIGAVTPLGNSFTGSWKAVLGGNCGIGLLSSVDISALKWKHAGEVKGLDMDGRFGQKFARRYDRFVLLALVAAEEAMNDAGPCEMPEAAVVIGSSRGGISSIEEAIGSRASAYLMSGSTISMAASVVSARVGSRGHVLGVSNACASGSNALGEAMRLIGEGRATVALAGGSEAPLAAISIKGYGASGALSKSGVMRPFSSGRDGFVLAEGACVLVLEEMESAQKSGRRIYAELAGYGNTSDAHHPTEPLAEGQVSAMRAALAEASIEEGEVGLVSAHATSTPRGDSVEAEAIGKVFTKGAASIPACAIKSMTGHMLAASGAFEVAVAAKAINSSTVPPSINYGGPGSLKLGISDNPREAEIKAAICDSFGFGGVNCVLALKAV